MGLTTSGSLGFKPKLERRRLDCRVIAGVVGENHCRNVILPIQCGTTHKGRHVFGDGLVEDFGLSITFRMGRNGE